jgi:hypothetical protein
MNKILHILLLLLLVSGCSSKWKETGGINFSFELNGTSESNFGFWFSSGQIHLGRLRFEGDRLQARDVSFDDRFVDDMKIDIPSGLPTNTLYYELPQGTYRNIKMGVSLENVADSLPSIMLNGYFRDSTGLTRDVIFKLNGKIESTLKTLYPGDRENYSILEGDFYTATIRFSIGDWFSTIPPSILQDAVIDIINSRETILISAERNVNIYSIILPKIGQFDEVQYE